MKTGPEVAMALDVLTEKESVDTEIKTVALNADAADSFALADLSTSVEINSKNISMQDLIAKETKVLEPIAGDKSPFEVFEDFKALEKADYKETALPINSKKISSSSIYSEAEKQLIARVVYAESRGEIFEGQVAVATVVINRYESRLFGNSFSKIVFASDQFAIGGKYNSESLKAVEKAIEQLGAYPKNMYYFQVSKSKTWRNFVYYKRIGNHSFYLSAD